MSEKLDVDVEKEEPKLDNIELEGEGIPRRFNRSEDYRRGYKTGWLVAKQNLLKKMSQSGVKVEEKSTENRPNVKKKSKNDEDVSTLTWAIAGLVLGGIVLYVIFNERNRRRSQSTTQ